MLKNKNKNKTQQNNVEQRVKLESTGQIQPTAWFGMVCELRVGLTFFQLLEK